MKKSEFLALIGLLQQTFGKVLEKSVLDLYFNLFSKYEISNFKECVEYLVVNFRPTSQVPFPVPKDFFEFFGETVEMKSKRLLGQVKKAAIDVGPYTSIDFGETALHSVISRFGGWPEVANWGQDDWKYNEGRFLAVLESALRYKEDGPEHMVGICDHSNQANGFDEFVKLPNRYLLPEAQKQIDKDKPRIQNSSGG